MSKLIDKVVHVVSDCIALDTVLGWATSLSAGEAPETSEVSFFKVVVDLTDAGHG